MQIDRKLYDPAIHDKFRALCVKQPYASLMTTPTSRDDDGEYHAEKSIEVRTRNTNHRGDLLICASAKPVIPGCPAGATCGLVDLYDVKRVEDFTEEDWKATCIPVNLRPRSGYGWMLRNPRRVVEMPVKGQLGIYDLVVPKGDITEYLRYLYLGEDGWKEIQSKIEAIKPE